MTRVHRRIALVMAMAGLLALPACGSSVSPASSTSTAASTGNGVRRLTPVVQAQLDKAVKGVLARTGAPGVIVGLWIPGNGSYVRAFGVADRNTRTAMSTGLRMRIGSGTKTFTVTGVLQLADQGKLRLDDPVSRYVSGVPNGNRITLRQLAEMRSGLYSYSDDPAFETALLADPHRAFTPQQLLRHAFGHPPQFRPGERFAYSNTNTVLLGLVVEKVSGQPLARYLKQHVLTPSHLDHTLLPVGAEFPQPHAHGYTDETSSGAVLDATDWNPSWAWAAGAMTSDLTDLHAWAPMVATGTLLTPATQAQRLRMLPTGLPGAGYGLGIFKINGWIGHNGSLPGYQSVTVYLPSARATLVVLVNTDISSAGSEPSTLFGRAVTGIVTPRNVYTLPSAPPASSTPAAVSPSPRSSAHRPAVSDLMERL